MTQKSLHILYMKWPEPHFWHSCWQWLSSEYMGHVDHRIIYHLSFQKNIFRWWFHMSFWSSPRKIGEGNHGNLTDFWHFFQRFFFPRSNMESIHIADIAIRDPIGPSGASSQYASWSLQGGGFVASRRSESELTTDKLVVFGWVFGKDMRKCMM